jgi:hypothetical protein
VSYTTISIPPQPASRSSETPLAEQQPQVLEAPHEQRGGSEGPGWEPAAAATQLAAEMEAGGARVAGSSAPEGGQLWEAADAAELGVNSPFARVQQQ